MTFSDAVTRLDEFDDEEGLATLYVRLPWEPGSDCRIFDQARRPTGRENEDLRYFLEVSVAKEVLEGLIGSPLDTLQNRIRLLIYYAENDAFPDWMNP